MKKLGKDAQISYRSVPEIVRGLDLVAAKLAMHEDFNGGKLRTGHVVNALALHLVKLPDGELVEFMSKKLRDLEKLLGGLIFPKPLLLRRAKAQRVLKSPGTDFQLA